MPERVVPTECVAHRICEVLYAGARCQHAVALRRLSCVPLASVLSNDVVEEYAEDIVHEGLVRAIHIECGAEVEGLAFALRYTCEDGAEVDAARILCTVIDEQVYSRNGKSRRGEHSEGDD